MPVPPNKNYTGLTDYVRDLLEISMYLSSREVWETVCTYEPFKNVTFPQVGRVLARLMKAGEIEKIKVKVGRYAAYRFVGERKFL